MLGEHYPMKDLLGVKLYCGAKTRSGGTCRKAPMKDKLRCRLHGGLSTGPKTEEGRRNIAAANYRHGRYINWRARREREKYYFSQIRALVAAAKQAGLY